MGVGTRVLALAGAVVFLSTLFVYSVPGSNPRVRAAATAEEYLRAGLRETEHYRFAEGLHWLEAARREAPQSGAVYVALGKHYFMRQDYVRAVDQFVIAARYLPGNSDILYYAGLLRSHLNGAARPESMLVFFDRAYQMDASNYPALREQVRIVAQMHGEAKATALVSRRLREQPRNASLWWVLGEAHAASGNVPAAIKAYRHALTLDAKLAPAMLSLADAYKRTGRVDAAVSQYWLGAMIAPQYTEGFFRAAQALLETKDYVQAESMVHYLLQIAPDYPGAYRLQAAIYNAGDRHDLAIEAMAQEVSHHPENVSDQVDLADAYIGMGQFEKAIQVVKAVTAMRFEGIREPRYLSDWVRGHVVLSKAYRGLRRYDAAAEAARVASRVDSRSAYIQREMAYVKAGLDFGN